MNKQTLLFLFLALIAVTPSKGQDMTRHDVLPPVMYQIDVHDNSWFFRIIAPDDALFGYKKRDYKGGFYLYFQLVKQSPKEVEKKTPFDKSRQKPRNYIAHYARVGSGGIGGLLVMPHYQVTYVEVPAGYDYAAFDPDDYKNQWKPLVLESFMPQDLLMQSTHNLYASEKEKEEEKEIFEAFQKEREEEFRHVQIAPRHERLDMALVKKLKADKQYDTIIETDRAALYVNTDFESYEYPADPGEFYVIYRQFHPDGSLKERRRFLPGVYASQRVPIGISASYDKSGKPTGLTEDARRIFPFPRQANVDFCLRFLEREGHVDRKTGKGKAVMKINHHVDPRKPSHGEPRLSIAAPWGMQVDDTPNGTVGLLVRHDDGRETAYILDKNSGIVLDKFGR